MKRSPDCPERRFVALNIKRLRAQRGISQDDLAFRSGLHRTYMSALERGKRNVSLDVLSRIAVALEVTLAVLVTEVEDASRFDTRSAPSA